MKRVRKYTYLPQEEIEVIETKSGQTIKSKEILDGNYVKAKPAPKKVVKKAVNRKYAKGGKVKLIFHGSSKEIDMGEFESAAAAKRYVESSDWKRPYSIKKMAKGGKLVGNQKKLDVNKNGKLDAEDFKMLRGEKMADGGYTNVDFSNGNYIVKAWQTEDDYNSGNAEEVGKFKNIHDAHLLVDDYLSPNKFEWYAAEIYDGNDGETLYNSEEDGYQEMADGGMIYKMADNMTDAEYEEKLSSLNEKQKKSYESLVRLGDSPKLALATTLLSKEAKWSDETESAYTMANGGMMAKGGKTPIVRTQFEEEEFEYAKGGTINMNKHIWEGWTVGNFIEALDIEFKYHPKFKSRDEVKKWAMESQPYYKKYIPDVVDYYWEKNEEKMTRGNGFEYYADGGKAGLNQGTYRVMIGNRKQRILADDMTRDEAKDFMYNYNLKHPKAELELRYNMTGADHKSVSDNVDKAMKEHMSGYKMADGGNVTDKEVADSNVQMLQSNIKSIKHHAEELEDAIKDNTEVEGWVLAKADRAATAMSDITHYIDGRKMGTGGMVAGHHYKDKAGNDLRYIGPDSKNDNMGVFKNGEKYLTKSFNDFEEEKEKKSFWFGNGGFMPSGFSRKVSLSEKAEEMVGKNTWHMLDAAQKGEVIGELISDGALAVTMDRGGIIDANDWAKSMTQDKIYALKKAGYSENIASEMSLLPYEQLPMWVRQDFKKGSIVIGAYHIHKNDNIPVDGKVLVLNGDEEVVYSAETLDQAQEWAINQMQEVEDEDDGNYIYVSDCCGAEAGDFYDVGICPMCREHCGWEKESTYADGGVTETTKFKVVYKLKDAAEPKEKLFDNAEKAEFFLETIQEDDDIESANLVEVKPMKKAAEKKAPTNLFAAAKPAAPSASKKTKEDVLVPGIADRIARYDALKAIIKNAEAEKEVIGGSLKEVGKEKFLELYELRRRNPDTFNLVDEDEKIMFYVMDKYIKVEPEKAGMLENYPGLLETTTTYKFNPALLDRTGEIISRLIMESTELSDDEKANLIVAETKIGIKTGSIDRLMDYDNPAQIFDLIEPIMALK